eukprot:gene13916-19846_t
MGFEQDDEAGRQQPERSFAVTSLAGGLAPELGKGLQILYKLGRHSAMNFGLSKDDEHELDSIELEELGIPDYFTIVKEPVDLNAIVTGLDSGAYSHFSQVYHHVLLVFTNAMRYNPPENLIHQLALKVRASFASQAMITMHQLQGMPAKSQTEPGKWSPPGSCFPLAPMPEVNPSLEQASEDLERFIRLEQHLLEMTDLNRQQLQSKDEQIAELHKELLNRALQDGASRGEGGDMEV